MNTTPSTQQGPDVRSPARSAPAGARGVKVGLAVMMLVSSALAVGAVLMKRENLREGGGPPLARARADIIHFESLARTYRRVAGELPATGPEPAAAGGRQDALRRAARSVGQALRLRAPG